MINSDFVNLKKLKSKTAVITISVLDYTPKFPSKSPKTKTRVYFLYSYSTSVDSKHT